jgi:hypothetical protein
LLLFKCKQGMHGDLHNERSSRSPLQANKRGTSPPRRLSPTAAGVAGFSAGAFAEDDADVATYGGKKATTAWDIISREDNLSILKAAIKANNLVAALDDKHRPVTVFAPTDAVSYLLRQWCLTAAAAAARAACFLFGSAGETFPVACGSMPAATFGRCNSAAMQRFHHANNLKGTQLTHVLG